MTKATLKVPGFVYHGPAPFSRVVEAFNRGPICVQRDHITRAHKAKYIGDVLWGDKLTFNLVMWQGKERLVDGYTRVQRVLTGLTKAPTTVLLTVHAKPANQDTLIALYDQFNSRAANKNTQDRFAEGMRFVDKLDDFASPLVVKGPKTAPKIATGAATVRDGVIAAHEAMSFVDEMGLDRHGETVGMLAAYYAIAKYGKLLPEQARDFITKMNQRKFVPKAGVKTDFIIAVAREVQEERRKRGAATGGAAAPQILHKVLAAFLAYMSYERFLPSINTRVTLGVFDDVMSAALATGTGR